MAMRVLVIEDEVKMADLIKRGLAEEGMQVEYAFDGYPGEAYSETKHFYSTNFQRSKRNKNIRRFMKEIGGQVAANPSQSRKYLSSFGPKYFPHSVAATGAKQVRRP